MSTSRWQTLPARYNDLAAQLGLPCEGSSHRRQPKPQCRQATAPKEYDHQVELIAHCAARYLEAPERYPGLNLLNASANGGKRTRGVAGQLKAMGVQDGFPDLELPVARGGYFSLYIELKRPATGRPTDRQLEWQANLRAQGHRSEICYGADAAWAEIEAYYALAPTTSSNLPS